MKQFSELEKAYVAARVEHSETAQQCWKLRAALERAGLTAEREQELNNEFGRQMMVRKTL